MFTWEDAFRIATAVVTSIGGIGLIIIAGARFLADRIAERHRRYTETVLAELQGRLDEGLSRLNAALQHKNFVLQRLAEIELNGIHSCWRAAAQAHFLVNGVRPPDTVTDPEVLHDRINHLASAQNSLLTIIGKYDPFLDETVRLILHEVAKLVRLETNQARLEPFTSSWWAQGVVNRAALEGQVTALRAAVQLRLDALRQVGDERPRA